MTLLSPIQNEDEMIFYAVARKACACATDWILSFSRLRQDKTK